MYSLAPQWLRGCRLRDCWFEPTFHKHAGKLCHGVQIHSEGFAYDHHAFKPWRIQALDRVAPTALPRSSIIISDEPLSKETNYRTEFVAVLSDRPQGGFLTRKPTPKVVPKPDPIPPAPRFRLFPFLQGG